MPAKKTRKRKTTIEVGHDARNGQFISLADARRRKATTIVQKIKR